MEMCFYSKLGEIDFPSPPGKAHTEALVPVLANSSRPAVALNSLPGLVFECEALLKNEHECTITFLDK